MDEQKERITSVDPKTGKSHEVNLVLDHDGPGSMKLSTEPVEDDSKEGR
ncbi:hypothetical protein [Paenibacillus mucilaginosus]|uniref:Uncharacterized protein n=3 Tax=Paenibacillus mucilaginosus TaxID=61624 RepID=H6NBX0_9BACL|nr:hypothetical protein [Paenibacillus mucilaginosus]AEI42208.1 hypothetical protein KNP414_03669 [Paenibacillus mucilaginosus KNP414]AFC28002.1 hypothetical protein PM3016_1066 [Paenibacillus mucilaginosus 3016]AFH60167.1 hypothetical protein B2K_05420 [Paenibacillus mucilaginosus K02]MCG7214174.1 hypothetical protein [Paenibacillus mucilaginosus]WDM28692.1 hypothetical protein KCX80_05615 [Paenibacillus mucilaginosus]